MWCTHSEGWTTLHTNCNQTERPDIQQKCFRVCDWHKDLYDWQLGAWNQCVPVSVRSAGVQHPTVCMRGVEGIQTREVGCVQKANGEPAEDAICEYFEPKPRLEQACLIPCPQDCVVSEFGSWTSCTKTCGMGLQNRLRIVLAPPLFGGAGCPNLTEVQTCQTETCKEKESLYSLRVGPWGPCSVLLSRQTRQADNQNDNTARVSNKTSEEDDKPSREGKGLSRGLEKHNRDLVEQPGDKLTSDSDKQHKGGNRSKEGERETTSKGSRRKLRKANNKPDRPSGQRPKQQKKAKHKKKAEKLIKQVQEREMYKGKIKDPETRERKKKQRNRIRQNRPGGKFWDLQVGYQTREVTCVHKSGAVKALK